jgi:hypothetical protein
MKGNITGACSLDPFTHIFMFDIGFPPQLQQMIALKFNCSIYARYLISWKAPRYIIGKWGYDVVCIKQFPTSMHGKYLTEPKSMIMFVFVIYAVIVTMLTRIRRVP